MFKYFPHTKADVDSMLKTLNIKSIDELYKDIPETVVFNKDYDIPSFMSETELRSHFADLSKKNQELTLFSGLTTH